MPELPEVETIRKTLKRFVVGRKIEDVGIYWSNIIKYPDDTEHFKANIIGETIHDIHRKGKYLLFELDEYMLVSHLRMEGKYNVFPEEDPYRKHTHVVFKLDNKEELRYEDVRKFGTMHLMKKGTEFNSGPLQKLAPDPLEEDFTLDYFLKKLQRTRRLIKAVLLDQTVVSGLGNIYVDETLFHARVHPEKRANELTNKEIELIYKYSKEVLDAAVKQGGTTIRSYVSTDGNIGLFQQELYVYGQVDEPCKNCSEPIYKLKVAGRGTHICTKCQKK